LTKFFERPDIHSALSLLSQGAIINRNIVTSVETRLRNSFRTVDASAQTDQK
jgi:hypothetical protein